MDALIYWVITVEEATQRALSNVFIGLLCRIYVCHRWGQKMSKELLHCGANSGLFIRGEANLRDLIDATVLVTLNAKI